MAKRVVMRQWFESKIEKNPDFFQNVSLYQAMSTARTLRSGNLKHQMKSFRDHCTL